MIILARLKGISPLGFLAQSLGAVAAKTRATTATRKTGNVRQKDDATHVRKPNLPSDFILHPSTEDSSHLHSSSVLSEAIATTECEFDFH
jgi:hypothetical protein